MEVNRSEFSEIDQQRCKMAITRVSKLPKEYVETAAGLPEDMLNQHPETVANLPYDYLFFLQWSNGFSIMGDEMLGFKENGGGIEQITYREQNLTNNLIPKYFIPFLGNGRGDHYCFDSRPSEFGQVIFWQWDYSDPTTYEVVSDSFISFFEGFLDEIEDEAAADLE